MDNNKLKLIMGGGILIIILIVVLFMGFGMGEAKSFTTVVKLVMAGVLAVLGVGVATLPEGSS